MKARTMMPLLGRLQAQESLNVGVIGLGYVGLPLATLIASRGHCVTGYDISESRLRSLHSGESYIDDVPSLQVAELVKAGRFTATSDFRTLEQADVAIICVQTPVDRTLNPDVSHVLAAAESIRNHLHPEQLVVLESTTYPGTTTELLLPFFQETGLVAGRDFYLAFSPERIDPSNHRYAIEDVPKVVGGVTDICRDVACTFYGTFINTPVPVSSSTVAELAKLHENTFRTVNIALVNEMAFLCDRLGVDVWEVIEAAATKPFGFMPFYPGPGLGGHCLPIDPHYLSWCARREKFGMRFIELAMQINESMANHVVGKVTVALNTLGKPVQASNILLLGVAYKRGVSDTRESPALRVATLLQSLNARLAYHDEHVEEVRLGDETLRSEPIYPDDLAKYDIVVILTDHDGIDYESIPDHVPLVVDTRHAIRKARYPHKVFRI
ncbi:MAG: nucleotide sugar dehydrogenase [Candidatus Poribacteria bacterium]|nr:nucleotide sugar dehydrogenase [Candidatus Poribacteria bacterium]